MIQQPNLDYNLETYSVIHFSGSTIATWQRSFGKTIYPNDQEMIIYPHTKIGVKNMEKKITIYVSVLVAILSVASATPSRGLTIGTFNIEYFTVEGRRAYSEHDCAYLASLIQESNVDVLALQEIEGDKSLLFLVEKNLPGWRFAGHQTPGKQNLYFLWNESKVEMTSSVEILFEEESINWGGEIQPLFRRHPIRGTFKEISSGGSFAMVNVHLQSLGTAGSKDRLATVAMNNGVRQAQVIKLNHVAEESKIPTFILGDFNSVDIPGAAFPVLSLPYGFSYDDLQCTIDHIGYTSVVPDKNWAVLEIETSISERTTGSREHPDHDMIILYMPKLFM